MKVLVLHTLPPLALPAGRARCEFELAEAAGEIARHLPGAVVAGVRGDPQEILSLLDAYQPEVVFNLCEAPLGRPDLEPHIAALFEWSGVRFTGSGSDTLALCRRKDRTRAVLTAAGVPVPPPDGFPCIVKPAGEDGSTAIDDDSICVDPGALERARKRIDGPVVVERFLSGTEFVVALWGAAEPDHFSIGQATFENGLRLFTYAAKWHLESADYANSRLEYQSEIAPTLRETVFKTARDAWRAVGARGYLRLDLRLDDHGVPCVLDVNPNPDVTPELAMHRAVEEAGWSWEQFVRKQIEWA
jgi:D-alanine-D-alanine ligase